MVAADRNALLDLLTRWERGEVSAWQVVEEAEEAEEAIDGDLDVVPELPKSDPNSIPVAVLGLLSTAHHQPLLPVDIPVLLRFLRAKPGGELDAWQELDRYFDSIDWKQREAVGNELYFGAKTGGAR